jgi:membrane protease YdiL (CAAX protease family)
MATLSKPDLGTRLSTSVILAWGMMLAVSLLPDVIGAEVLHIPVNGLLWLKLALLLGILLGGLVWKPVRPFRNLALMLILLVGGEWLRGVIAAAPAWTNLFGGANATFVQSMFSAQLLRVLLALVMLVFMLVVLRFSARRAYLLPGQLRASVGAIPLLGFKAGQLNWGRFGWMSALAIAGGTLIFLLLSGAASVSMLPKVVAYLPVILLFAAMNAFGEEVSYRSALLAPLKDVVTPAQAVMLTALFFGIGHYYGVPYGIIGIVMASFLGWLMGKSMVETGGLFWPWFIHVVQDVLIFAFMVMGLRPGG